MKQNKGWTLLQTKCLEVFNQPRMLWVLWQRFNVTCMLLKQTYSTKYWFTLAAEESRMSGSSHILDQDLIYIYNCKTKSEGQWMNLYMSEKKLIIFKCFLKYKIYNGEIRRRVKNQNGLNIHNKIQLFDFKSVLVKHSCCSSNLGCTARYQLIIISNHN